MPSVNTIVNHSYISDTNYWQQIYAKNSLLIAKTYPFVMTFNIMLASAERVSVNRYMYRILLGLYYITQNGNNISRKEAVVYLLV